MAFQLVSPLAALRTAILLCLLLSPRLVQAEADERLPVPAQSDVTKAQKLIRSAYDVQFRTAVENSEPAPLLDELRSFAEATDDPVRKYALLVEARKIASEFDDAASTLAFVDLLSEAFMVDALLARANAQDELATPRIVADLPLLEEALVTAKSAAADRRYDIAEKSATLALNIAQAINRAQRAAARNIRRSPAPGAIVPEINGPALIRKTRDLQSRLRRESQLYAAYEEAQLTLDTRPDDAAANAAMATYLCYIAEDWNRGLPHLSKSTGLPRSGLAEEERRLLAAEPPVPEQLFALAGRWWAAAESSTDAELAADPVRRHATGLYRDVIRTLKDPLEIKLAVSRIRACKPPLADPRGDGSRTITLIAHGQLIEEVTPATGWTEHDGFFEGRGTMRGVGRRARGSACPLVLIRDLGSRNFTLDLEIAVEIVDGTASAVDLIANGKTGVFGLDGLGSPRTFIQGSLFKVTAGHIMALDQGHRYRMALERLGDQVKWSMDGLPAATVRLNEADLEELVLRPHRGCLRIFNATLTRLPDSQGD